MSFWFCSRVAGRCAHPRCPPVNAPHNRLFHISRWLGIRTRDMSDNMLAGLKINKDRLMNDLHYTCGFGSGKIWGNAPTETGMSRLSLSDYDKQVRDWFAETTQSLGCKLTVDMMGNMFAVRPERNSDEPPTCVGSHLDTQPSGGRYDGILGIHAGVEMLKVLEEHKVDTEYPVGVVNWTNEEGARFPISMVASGVWAEEIGLDTAHNLQEVGGGTATMKSELERIGYLGSTPASYKATPMAAHFELHIEQGPLLEGQKQKIGVVQGVQAYRWFTVDIEGRDAHTGTTPFSARADALLLAARCITHSHVLATSHDALASTGILTLHPGSVNTIPGRVRFSLDIRASRDSTLDKLEAGLKRDFASLAAGVAPTSPTPGAPDDARSGSGGGTTGASLLVGSTPGLKNALSVSWQTDSVSTATLFHADCIGAVRAAALSVLGRGSGGGAGAAERLIRDMTSGAGHDSVYASRRCPTSMIFVPCRRGVSHNPEEYTSPEDCAVGAEVLMQSVLRFDRARARRDVVSGGDG